MITKILGALACFILLSSPFAAAESYDARIAEKQILTPVPPAAPRINGPVVCGARPGRQFIYRIPTQGERPIRFEVKGLPAGLKLDAVNGIITGVTPEKKGDYVMTFAAKNGRGETKRSFKLVVGDKLALTPPTGWNSWGGEMINVNDAVMRKAADMFVERGLADVGFQYLGIDDCWMRLTREMYEHRREGVVKKHAAYDYEATGTIGPIRDEYGNILFNLCQYGDDNPWTWAPELGIQTWRTSWDLNHTLHLYFNKALSIATTLRAYNQPGQWNDPDFMYIHRVRDVSNMGEASVEIKLDTNQRYQYVTLWAIICAPFFFSCDVENIDEFTVRLLGNADVLNISQDELGHTAEVIRNDDKKETVMLKKLADGSKAMAVFNRDAQNEAAITVNWEDIGGGSEPEVFDVWRQKSLGHCKGGITVQLSPNGVGLFIIKE